MKLMRELSKAEILEVTILCIDPLGMHIDVIKFAQLLFEKATIQFGESPRVPKDKDG